MGATRFTYFLTFPFFDSDPSQALMSSYLPQLLAVLVPGGVQLVVFLGWLHRRIRGDEINHAFVFDVATNHLPHIYDALCAIAEQQGIVLDAPPAELSTDPKKTCIFFL